MNVCCVKATIVPEGEGSLQTITRRSILLVAVTGVLLAPTVRSLRADREPDEAVDFRRQIRPILLSKCFTCHGPDEKRRKADLRLDLASSAHGRAIVPGNPSESAMIQRITSTNPDERMPPPDSTLEPSTEEVSLLTQWVSAGGIYDLHWAFVPPERPTVEAPDDDEWGHNEIDVFVLDRLKKESLEPSPPADRITLIRRLSLDLTGLPPTGHAVDRFLRDDSPRAYERMVARLFASEHYGERMAQDWLDLARYGDTNGYENDSERYLWLYREWVIDALNDNMPFDQFTMEQIAGDLLPNADDSQKIASGFNRNTTYNEEGGADDEEFAVAYAVERASTTGTVFLGLTLGCAQCHDHKYDPISQKEFYQFYAFFNSVDGEKGARGHDIPLPPLLYLPSKEQAETRRRTNEEIEKIKAHITEEVAKVSVTASVATDADATTTTASQEVRGGEDAKKTDERLYFATQAAWEAHERELIKRGQSKLPKEIRTLLKIELSERGDAQLKQVRDRFAEFSYAGARHIFAALHNQLEELEKKSEEIENAIPKTMVMKEMAERKPAHVLLRGDFEQKAEQVKPGVPAILPPLPSGLPQNRLALAHWLIDPENPLVARVAVNRFWKQFFGTGLVTTMEDFGVRGELPTHPELLDWLASEFIRSRWNVKALQKRIVMSAAYRQSSRIRPDAIKTDPYNRLIARQNRFRITAEEIRDTALAVSGLLNDQIGGPSVYPYQPEGYYNLKGMWKWPQSKGRDLYRRGLYTFWRRTTTYPTFQIFDAPSRETCTVNRPRTNTPLQALVTLNDPTFVDAARALGERIMREGASSIDERLTFAFRAVLVREPDDGELDILRSIYDERRADYDRDAELAAALVERGGEPAPVDLETIDLATWTCVANVLLNLDEMITRE